MKVLGNRLVTRRNRGTTIEFKLQRENGDPLIISSGWDNPYLVMTIASSRYTYENRYIKSWWVPLNGLTVVSKTDFYLDPANTSDYPSFNYATWDRTQAVKVIYNNTNYYWYSDGTQWRTYFHPVIPIVFTVQDASEWIEQTYSWDVSLVAGTLTGDSSGAPLKDFIVVQSLVEDAILEVFSDSVGGLS